MANKQPKTKGESPPPTKTPRIGPADSSDNRPVWRVGKIDAGGPWCPHTMDAAEFTDLLNRLKSFETMTWTEIERTGSHFIGTDAIISEAKRRLVELHLDDFDQLFSLRLQGRPRLWGMRIGNVFSALWWDAEHAICPSAKKHT